MPEETTPEPVPAKREPCKTCLGCGKVDSRDKKSWRIHSKLPNLHPDVKARDAGQIVPKICPECEGKGFTDDTEGKGLGLVPALKVKAEIEKGESENLAREESQTPEVTT